MKGGSLGSLGSLGAHGSGSRSLSVYHKRTSYEGTRRRRFGSQAALPTALQKLTDEELDARNARVWATVLTDCQAIRGMSPDLAPNLRSAGPNGETQADVRLVVRTAVWICMEKFGVPVSRLRELAESNVKSLNEWRAWAAESEEAQQVVAQWEASGGYERVELTETRLLAVPGCLLDALTREAAACDTTIPALLARLLDER